MSCRDRRKIKSESRPTDRTYPRLVPTSTKEKNQRYSTILKKSKGRKIPIQLR